MIIPMPCAAKLIAELGPRRNFVLSLMAQSEEGCIIMWRNIVREKVAISIFAYFSTVCFQMLPSIRTISTCDAQVQG
jgi:hypothetical protein